MRDLAFDNLNWLNLLWAVLGLAAIGAYGIWQRRRGLRLFASAGLLPRLVPGAGWGRPLVRLGLVTTCLLLLVAALIGPRWGAREQPLVRRNIDVAVLLDVSRSMLARDIAPSRLERAKLAIRDDLLPALGGDRIGLIAFAGEPSVACPLTTDYGFFRLALQDISIQSAPRGGTLIGDALRRAGDLLRGPLETHRIVLLITDGEDQESYPVAAAAALWDEQRVPVIALALGDPEQGARIPLPGGKPGEFVQHGGQEVWSRADFASLGRVAEVSRPHGLFIAVGTSNFDLGAIYRKVAGGLRATEQIEQRRVQRPTRFHPFVIAALAVLLVDSLLREGPRRTALAARRAPAGPPQTEKAA